jgi:gas vesicle protein
MSNDNFGSFLAGLLVGAVAGAGTAILFAPDNGKRTRKRIHRKLRDLNFKLDDMVSKSKDTLHDLKEDMDHNFTELSRKGKKILE